MNGIWQELLTAWIGCGVLNVLLVTGDELMVERRLALQENMRLMPNLDWRELGYNAAWGFVLGLLILPTIFSIITVGRVLLRFLWTGVWR